MNSKPGWGKRSPSLRRRPLLKWPLHRQAAEEGAKSRIVPEPGEEGKAEDPIEALADLPLDVLIGVLQGEQANMVALVLNSLPIALAGEVLQRLPPAICREVPRVCLSRQSGSKTALLHRIAQALLHKRARRR